MQNLSSEEIPEGGDPSPAGTYRIGGVSRLTGVPVPTLRVWETRHGAFRPSKSTGQHRLYTEADVIKARLLRQLTAAGHSVGRIAGLSLPQLQQLLGGGEAAGPAPAPRAVKALVVGDALAARLGMPGWQARGQALGLRVQRVVADLDDVDAAPEGPAPDVLLARVNAVQPASFERLARALARSGAGRAIVLYNFGAEAVLEAMRTAGMVLRREPVTDAELADLVRSVTVVDAAGSLATVASGATIPRRRFSDAALAKVAAGPAGILCECPRHLAELITQLASFEEFSAQCLHASQEDAHLHAYLQSIAGSSRALFEHALQLTAQHAGLALPPAAPGTDGA